MAVTIPRQSWNATMNPMKRAIAPDTARRVCDCEADAASANSTEESAKKKAESIQKGKPRDSIFCTPFQAVGDGEGAREAISSRSRTGCRWRR